MLILTGFGISDSLQTVIKRQYEDLQHYDVLMQVASTANQEGLYQDLEDSDDVLTYTRTHTELAESQRDGKIDQQVNVVVPLVDSENFSTLITLRDLEEEPLDVTDGPIISDKFEKKFRTG